MSGTPSKVKDKERIIKLLHESILHLCKVSVSGPGNIEVDGIVCITQPNEGDIVVKVHETFSNIHNDKDDGKSPMTGEKRKYSQDSDGGSRTPRKDGGRTPTSRRLLPSGGTIDLSRDDDNLGVSRLHRSPNRNKKSDVIDLTAGRMTPGPQMNITQVRSLGQQQRFGATQRFQRFVSVRGRGGYQMVVPRQRFMGRGNMVPPGMRQIGPGGVRPVGGPIPHRAYRPQAGTMMGARAQMPGTSTAVPNTSGSINPATSANNGSRLPMDAQVHGYKGMRCKYKDCNFACSNKYYLETHVLQHFESDPFACNEDECEFKSKNKQHLYQHYKAAHGANNPQFCFKCIKAFKSPEELAEHTPSCTIAAIKCDHCGEMINGMMAMAKHLSDVYIAESTKSQGAEQSAGSDPAQSHTSGSPATTPSPGNVSGQSPTAMSPQRGPTESPGPGLQSAILPDMSSPLNIIPDAAAQAARQAQTTPPVQSEIEQLQQMAGTSQPQTTEPLQYQPPSLSVMDYKPTGSNEMQFGTNNQEQPIQRMTQPDGLVSDPPNLNPTLPFDQQTFANMSNLDLLNQPMSMDHPQLDPIQMPSLGDPMSLPDVPMDTKPPDFNT